MNHIIGQNGKTRSNQQAVRSLFARKDNNQPGRQSGSRMWGANLGEFMGRGSGGNIAAPGRHSGFTNSGLCHLGQPGLGPQRQAGGVLGGGSSRANTGQPSSGQPNTGQPSSGQPNTGQPSFISQFLTDCLSSKEETRAKALERLTKCTDGGKFLPEIVSLIGSGVNFSCNKEEYNLSTLFRCTKIIKALVDNKNLSLEGHLSALITTVSTIILCDRIYGNCGQGSHWDLRLRTGRLLSQILRTNLISSDLATSIAYNFSRHLDQNSALVTIYGSLVGLRAIGPKFLMPKVGLIIARIDFNHKTVDEIVAAETIRQLLVETVQPILPRMKNIPELGTLWAYFQTQPCATSQLKNNGDTSLSQFASPPPKRAKVACGPSETGYNSAMAAAVGAGFEGDGNQNNGPAQVNPVMCLNENSAQMANRATTTKTNQVNPTMDCNENSAQTAGRSNTATTNQETAGVSSTLHIYNLKHWMTEETIHVNFSRYGKVIGIKTNKKKFFTHVRFSTRKEAEHCLNQMKGKDYGIFKDTKISWATTDQFRQDHTEYYKFCEEFGLCYNFNVHDLGCSLASCKRKHCCLFCFQLFAKEEPHPSRTGCPNEKEGYLKFGPRNQ